MEIILGKTAGFCYGVERAVSEAKKAVEENSNIDCLGEIVHNKTVVENLKKDGINFIQDVEDAKEKLIIRAHGASRKIYENLEKRGIKIIDLTCPKVLKTHTIAEKYSKENYFIVLIGIKDHPESIGTLSFCGENSYLLQEEEEVTDLLEKIEQSKLDNILIFAQTTYNSKKFDKICDVLKEKLNGKNVEIQKTICGATEIRQKETRELACNVDCMIIVGDKKSSNTNKLFDISKENCKSVLLIQNANELDLNTIKNAKKIGIMAGASTPKEDIDKIIEKLRRNEND